MEDEEYKKLPIEDRCVHKLWKARVNGYEEVTKLFKQIDDEKSPEFGKYLGLVKKFVIDTNAMGQEKGLEATLAYVENYAHAGKTVSEVMSGIVTKCMAAPKAKTRELALQITLMYIEIERQEAVLEELLKGMELKNPKIVAACVVASTTALKEFGIKIITPKPLVKKLPALFADRDKTVRDEARQLAIEMYRWMGPALRPQLSTLQPLQITELEAEFSKIEGQKVQPTRYIKSQQQKQAKIKAEAEAAEDCEEEDEEEDAPQIDSYDLADPVDILSKLPKDFYEKLEAKKWQERKESLELLENLLKTPKLENGEYGDLVRALKKIIQKDSNVICVALAAKCYASLASSLKKRFQTYAGAVIPALLEKFKEKKQNVLIANREAIDAIYLTTSLEAILEDTLEALNNKNPSVKSETALFLARSLTKTQPQALNKKLLKAITSALEKNVNQSDPTVRDSSYEALGTLMKLVGEKAIGPFLGELEKDNLKMTKIKEFCEKVVISVKVSAPKKEKAPVTIKTKETKSEQSKPATSSKTVKKGAENAKKKPQISSGSATIVKSKGAKGLSSKINNKPIERELSDEEVDSLIADKISANIISDIASANWKSRLAAVEQLQSEIQTQESKDLPCQALVKFISRKPGLKDTNFQVLKAKLDLMKYLVENCTFSVTVADCCLNDLTEKFGDPKNGNTISVVISAIAEAAGFPHVANVVLDFAVTQKSPKVTSEAFLWLSNAILEFGFANLNTKVLIDHSKKALASANPAVRQAAISLLGTMYLYIGPSLIVCFESEKATLREQIQAEFDKHDGEQAPAPSRGVTKSESVATLDNLEDAEEGEEAPVVNIQDILPRIDISSQITETLINEMSDKNWKVRNEALTKVSTIIQEAKLIKPNIGNLPQALSERLGDSNTKIAQLSTNLCEALAKAMGPPIKQHVRTLLPGILQGLGDNKAWMRTAALDAMNAFADQGGYKEFFEGEMIGDALKTGSPVLRSELWAWLGDKMPKIPLKTIPKDELTICIPYLYNNLEDRNADVRKNAQEAILGFMIHTSYESMLKQTEKLKPGSKNVIVALLEKVRPNLPVKALPKMPPPEKEVKSVKGTKPVANAKNAVKPKSANVARQSTVPSRKKEDDVDTSPLLVVNNMKHQRTIDESKLKVLKWNFTTPREEFVELLREQMTNANVNRTLLANMFHSDFRYHLKAIESLNEDLAENGLALISNLDLILKWLTLRFFDTNPSVLLKGLDYLNLVFEMLIDNHYRLQENEASSFIPYLIVKIGDPKDAVRNSVKALFRQIAFVYPVSRLFTCIMEGLKSKNARQRAECLDVMGSMIELDGITICVPSPTACLKEVAKQISDRDNSVRNAALNCAVQAYLIVGEKIYKMVGNISDKDLSMLEERIKRAKKNPVKSPVKAETTQQFSSTNKVVNQVNTNFDTNNTYHKEAYSNGDEQDEEDEEELSLPPVTLPPQVTPKPKEIDGPFKLDVEFMKELDKIQLPQPKVHLEDMDLNFLKEDVKATDIADDKSAKVMPLSPPMPITSDYQVISCLNTSRPKEVEILSQMSSSDMVIALEAFEQMQKFLISSRSISMIDHEDEFMKAAIKQLEYLSSKELDSSPLVLKTYRSILSVINQFYVNKILGRHISISVLKGIIHSFIQLLVQGKLEGCTEGETYIRVINLHCCKIIERSDHTRIFCALIQLSQDCLRTEASPRQTELVMKCLWRIIKLMPQWGNEIHFDEILTDVLNFFKEFPPCWWKMRPSDTLLRTIKTVVHSSVKIRGNAILQDLEKVQDYKNSEVESYILKQLKALKLDDGENQPVQSMKVESSPAKRNNLSKSIQNQLTEIFQKIGTKDETKEGLNLLYDFIQEHPEADIDPFLKKCSTFFQGYIKNALKDIKEDRESSQNTIANKVVEKVQASILPPPASEEPGDKGTDYWRDRLHMFEKMYGGASKVNE
ncbi:protein mini spindles isoform X2 [Harmonia axyridis]|uniref:protein mini spindles isoform X2 n=1 Tax=Harmonia axyridis TaxID=115357 RepID=UPI001E274FBF|nr:protein mini spindles isoform X2 [Harmonia axyridis]